MIYRGRARVYDDLPPEEVVLPDSLQAYAELWQRIEAEKDPGIQQALLRLWSAADGYFLLRFILSPGRHAWDHYRHEPHFQHQVHIDLARRIQFDTEIDDTVLIGARGLGKSTHFDADDIRALLIDPNFAIFYFSLTKELAKKRLATIKTELDTNAILLDVWSDRFWKSDEERATAGRNIPWGESTGLCIKRTTTRPEQSIEAHSFEHALPTGMHPDRRRYDDIEADRSVASDITQETLKDRWVSSQNITSSLRARRTTGTYYSASALMVLLSTEYGMRKAIFPGEDTNDPVPPEEAGPLGGRPVNGFTREHLWDRLKDAGGAEFVDGRWRKTTNAKAIIDYARQTACDPQAGEATRLDWKWIRFYEGEGWKHANNGTIVVCADCSPGTGDPTWIWVWLLTREREFWWVDAERKVVDPTERRKLIHDVCQRWVNYGVRVEQLRLEQFGQATYVQDQQAYWDNMPAFPAPPIVKCNDNRSPGKGEGKVWSTYERWQPHASAGKIVFPREMWRQDERGVPIELVGYFRQFEWDMFPKSRTDDGLDSGKLIWEDPKRVGALPWPTDRWSQPQGHRQRERSAQSAGLA